jgi:hypothetical protein
MTLLDVARRRLPKIICFYETDLQARLAGPASHFANFEMAARRPDGLPRGLR